MKTNFLSTFFYSFILSILTGSVLLISQDTFAQRTCQTSETEYYLNNKDAVAGSEVFENKLNGYIIQKEKKLKNNPSIHKVQTTEATYRIPIIVHIIHNGEPIGEGSNISTAQVYGQIEILNEDFNFRNSDKDKTLDVFKDVAANPSIEFVLATIDPNGNPLAEAGIHRSKGCLKQWDSATFDLYAKPSTVWNPNDYFNIWVTNMRSGAYGYAQFPVLSNLDGIRNENQGANTDGIVVSHINFGSIKKTPTIPQLIEGAPLNLGRTATHEIGHYFGLLHTWGSESLSCASDDFCADTPNTNTRQRGCKLNEASCETGKIVMTQNFMEYTDDSCMTLFTKNQVERMHAVLEISPRRKELLLSKAADPIQNRIFALFSPSKTNVIKNSTVKFINQSLSTGNIEITGYEWSFEGGTPATSTEVSPTVTYSNQGSFLVTLKVKGSDGSQKTNNMLIIVIDDNLTALNQTLLDFEDRNFQKEGWSVKRTDIVNWRLFSSGASGASNFSAYVTNKDNRSCETELAFISPFIRTSTNRTFEVSFDVAYTYDTSNLSDSLEISYATDGGDKFIPIWKQGGTELQTATTRTTAFSPLATEWKSYKFYIETEEATRFIQIKFKNIGANNNNLYLDNLHIRQATDLLLPIVDFDVNYPLILISEKTRFYSKTEFGIDFNWTIEGNTNLQASGISPQISFSQEGVYDVTLNSSNTLGTKELKKTNAIQVIEGKKTANVNSQNLKNEVINGKPLAGHDGGITVSKAEFFNDLGLNNRIYAVDIFFADAVITNLNKTFDVVMWSVDANGKPSEELYRQKVPYSLINRDIFERRQFTRVIFDEPQNVPAQFFISVELESESLNTFSIFTEKKQEGKGWEKKANGDWVSYLANRGQNYSNAISLILSPDGVLGVDDEDNLNDLVNLYPNPNQGSFSLETQNLRVESIEIYNSIGQIIYQKNISNAFLSNFDIQLNRPSNGIYLVRIQTQKGIITQKLVIQN